MFMLVCGLVSTFWMKLLPKLVADLAICLPELVADDEAMPELPSQCHERGGQRWRTTDRISGSGNRSVFTNQSAASFERGRGY